MLSRSVFPGSYITLKKGKAHAITLFIYVFIDLFSIKPALGLMFGYILYSNFAARTHLDLPVSRSPDSTIDDQPPALPPKQTRRPLSSQSQSHSQQELDNHINELYDTPLSEDKTMVGERPTRARTHTHTL